MLTERIATLVDSHVSGSPWTEETGAVIEKYVGPLSLVRRTQYQELALVAVHGLIMVLFVLGVAFAGGVASGLGIRGATDPIYRVAVAGLSWCCVGLGLHLSRYYVALLATYRHREYAAPRYGKTADWPRSSSDADFLLQAAVAAIAAAAV